jgi:hypothetical protein
MLKSEFSLFRQSIFLQPEISALNGRISSASEGNFLEANNLALNVFDKHFTDRDLNRTGLSVFVVSPGSGMFEIDPDLFKLTKASFYLFFCLIFLIIIMDDLETHD